MSTPLTDSINALTAYANEVTGGSDTNLSDAVHTLASGYGGGMAKGTYIPSSDGATAVIDIGATEWTHFLIVPHTLPYATPYTRCLGMRYINRSARFTLYSFGPSRDSAIPSQDAVYTDSTSPNFDKVCAINGTVLTLGGVIASQGGSFQAGTQYDWYAW